MPLPGTHPNFGGSAPDEAQMKEILAGMSDAQLSKLIESNPELKRRIKDLSPLLGPKIHSSKEYLAIAH